MKYKAVLFDFDFTLADATAGITGSANHALKALGFDIKSYEEIRKTVGLTLPDTFRALTGCNDELKASRFVELFVSKADEIMTKNTELFIDTKDTLIRLKTAGIKTGIVTTKLHYRIDEALDRFERRPFVDCIIGLEDVKIAKPDPEGLFKAIENLSVEKEYVLYVGDSIIDAEAASNASLDFAAVTTGTTCVSDFYDVQHVLIASCLEEVTNFIFK